MRALLFCLPLLALICACRQKDKQVSSIFRTEQTGNTSMAPDLPELEENGELIAATLSGPDTYFEFRGQCFGLQYEMVTDFARSHGLRIRMEIAHDSLELVKMLLEGEVDVIALPMPPTEGCTLVVVQDSKASVSEAQHSKAPHDTTGRDTSSTSHTLGWLTRSSSPLLSEALNAWYSPQLRERILARGRQEKDRKQRMQTRHNPRPKVKDATQGILSDYDGLFRRHASRCGWDWRLLAAQCYQESCFDAQAVSWAGAQGLMQLMPATAEEYGAAGHVFDPETNILAATRFLARLNADFAHITQPDERIYFVLAAYNGGPGHVRDAMALTEKHGGNPRIWGQVRPYILALSDPKFYRDPVVRYGYLRGSETAHYVDAIRSHWTHYRTIAK